MSDKIITLSEERAARISSAMSAVQKYLEGNFSDTDFDVDGNLSEVHAEISVCQYILEDQINMAYKLGADK